MKNLPWIIVLPGALGIVLAVLTGCGQVITAPTSTPAPTATHTPLPVSQFTSTPTPAPLTPLPTFTPTTTPTPVIYTVKSGDNLLAIARQFGVTVESIQEVNGILDPRRLQIGQELLIPMDEDALREPATPTPTPMPFQIQGINFQLSPSGRLWCLGEMENLAGVDLEQVEVAVSLFDSNGEMSGFGTTYAELDVVPVGGRAPFVIAIDNPPDHFSTYQSVPLKALPLTRQGSYYRDLEIVSHEGESRGHASYTVTGRVRNAGDQPAQRVRVIVTGYDSDGLVAAVRKVSPADDTLLPGRSIDFQINLLSTAGAVVRYTLATEGLAADLTGEDS